jgi:hypothetical protein
LVRILEKAGWLPDTAQPALPEPVANLYGIFTEGRNKTWTPNPNLLTECPNFNGMFPQTALYQAIRKHWEEGKPGQERKIYWAMVVDLGGYTSDFAMIGLNLGDIEERIEGSHQGKPRKADHSEPLGVYDLDKHVRSVLRPLNQKGFDEVIAEVDSQRVDRFHQVVYQDGAEYTTGQGYIGSEPAERDRIKECVSRFSNEVSAYAKRFCIVNQYDRIDELILTGGGFNIPTVRDAVIQALAPFLTGNSHVPAAEDDALPAKCLRLDRILVRGATAIGGASVFFDYTTGMV